MSANPFFITTDENPNEIYGVRACSFAGQQKSADCAGQWNTWHSILVAGSRAVRMTVCDHHLREAAAARPLNTGPMAGYATTPSLHTDAGVNPMDTPDRVPKRTRKSKADEAPSL